MEKRKRILIISAVFPPEQVTSAFLNYDFPMPSEKLIEIGQNGQQFVLSELGYQVLGKKMVELYSWVINGGKAPDFVYFR